MIIINLIYQVIIILFVVPIEIDDLYQYSHFQEQPTNHTVSVGDDTKLSCIVQNIFGKVYWIKDGIMLDNLSADPSYNVISVGNDFSLVITNVTKENEGKYNCEMLQPDSSEAVRSDDAYLTVTVAVAIIVAETEQGPRVKINLGLIMIFILFTITIVITFCTYLRSYCYQNQPQRSNQWEGTDENTEIRLMTAGITMQTGESTITPSADC